MQTDARNGTLSTTVGKPPSVRRGARHNFLKIQHIRAQAFISVLDDRDSPLKVRGSVGMGSMGPFLGTHQYLKNGFRNLSIFESMD